MQSHYRSIISNKKGNTNNDIYNCRREPTNDWIKTGDETTFITPKLRCEIGLLMDKVARPALLQNNAFSQLMLTELGSVNETESEDMRDIEVFSLR